MNFYRGSTLSRFDDAARVALWRCPTLIGLTGIAQKLRRFMGLYTAHVGRLIGKMSFGEWPDVAAKRRLPPT
jgi:hypothetical protein